MNKINSFFAATSKFIVDNFHKVTADTMEWCTIVILHCATIPTLLALMTGLSDRTPGLDIVLFVWAGLVLLFGRAILLKNRFHIITNGSGFITQAVLMAMILFK